MIDDGIHARTARRYRPQPGDGPVIDQEGRVVEPDATSRGRFESTVRISHLKRHLANSPVNSASPGSMRWQAVGRAFVVARHQGPYVSMPDRLIPVVGDISPRRFHVAVREARAVGAPWHVTARMLGTRARRRGRVVPVARCLRRDVPRNMRTCGCCGLARQAR